MGLFDKEEKKPVRFEIKSEQHIGAFYYLAVLVDTETGVNYTFTAVEGHTALNPLIGADGKIIVDEIGEKIY